MIKSLSVIISILFLTNNANAAEIFLKEGDQHEICREIKQIMEEPDINKEIEGNYYVLVPEFKIPKKYTNFKLPEWKTIDINDLDKYVKPRILTKKELTSLMPGNQMIAKRTKYTTYYSPSEAIDDIKEFSKKFEGKARVIIQKTRIDLNNDGKADVVLRFMSDSPKYYSEYVSNVYWRQYVSDIEPNILSVTYNNDNSPYGVGGLFTVYSKSGFFTVEYKGEVIEIMKQNGWFGRNVFYDYIVSKPRMVKDGREFEITPICKIQLKPNAEEIINRKKRQKELEIEN